MADDNGWPDPAKIEAAARDLVTRKPHFASRRPSGDAGEGARTAPPTVGPASILRQRAG